MTDAPPAENFRLFGDACIAEEERKARTIEDGKAEGVAQATGLILDKDDQMDTPDWSKELFGESSSVIPVERRSSPKTPPWSLSEEHTIAIRSRINCMIGDDMLSASNLMGLDFWFTLSSDPDESRRRRQQAGRLILKMVKGGELPGLTIVRHRHSGSVLYVRSDYYMDILYE
jgi:hypothetical protein